MTDTKVVMTPLIEGGIYVLKELFGDQLFKVCISDYTDATILIHDMDKNKSMRYLTNDFSNIFKCIEVISETQDEFLLDGSPSFFGSLEYYSPE